MQTSQSCRCLDRTPLPSFCCVFLHLGKMFYLKQGTSSARSLKVLHYEGWTGEVGGDTSHMLQLVDTLTTTLMEAETPTLLIQCCDGVGKSGLFSALCDVINHMTYDREIDVYMTVRHVQNVRPSAVTSLAQYRYCYEVAQQRHRDMSIYANT
ncbi:receptor-type tyrosine-protein phosphatase alpha-like [Littorina saxatilis]